MAELSISAWNGVILVLNNQETITVLNSSDAVASLLGMVGGYNGFAGSKGAALACAMVAGYIKLQGALVKQANKKGKGVIFSFPWTAFVMGPTAILAIQVLPR